MLQLKGITKNYLSGDNEVKALKGIDLEFRESEFVSILGQSGCGKTTMLNIIGGLDRYTSGDLVINGKSTKQFKDKDWDTYRNHSVGFVFQSYNLIPHQTVLANVELALTISGVGKEERRKRAIDALTKVGLGDQINKKPNQMSGGQMQRVAIARALVNDPDILLADEPTGALDSKTSEQVMEILKDISKDRLIIMVTHNPELAKKINLKQYIDYRYNQSLSKVEILDNDSFDTSQKRKISYLTINWFMQTLIERADRMSMANGFEVRVPFCDYRLAEYMYNVPWEMKAYKGREKGLLRHVVKDLLPEEIVTRKKSPYPKTHNPTYLKKVKQMLIQIMKNPISPINTLLNRDYILDIINTDGASFTRPWFGQLMTGPQLMAYLCQVNMWL